MGSDNFSSTLDLLKGYYVNLFVGEEIIKGKLMGVETDHLVLEDEKNYIYYYSIDKIQAITKNTKQFQTADINTDYLKTQSLVDLLNSLKNTWVSILCLNKQSFDGVLSIVDTDFVTLINGENRILVKISHIANILKGFRKEEKSEENSNESKENKNEAQQEEKSKKNDDRNVETEVIVKKSKAEPKVQSRDKVKMADKETLAATTKVTNAEPEKDFKIWSEPINKTVEKPIVLSTPKNQNEMKKPIGEAIQMTYSESKQPKQEIKQNLHSELKKKKLEVVQNIIKQEKESIQKAPVIAKENRSPMKEIVREPLIMETPPKKEVSRRQTKDLLNKVKKVQNSHETHPFMKIENTKKSTDEIKNKDVTPKAQEVGASRFAGEPAPREFNRRSIFSGWPNRNTTAKRF